MYVKFRRFTKLSSVRFGSAVYIFKEWREYEYEYEEVGQICKQTMNEGLFVYLFF